MDGADIAFSASAGAVAEANQLTVRGNWRQLFRCPDGPSFQTDIPPLPERLVELR